MNILVVDDEIYARKALIKQVTELLGSRPCELYEAQDADWFLPIYACPGKPVLIW